MAYQRTSQSIRAYNAFKAIVTLVLVVIILILLLRGCRSSKTLPEAIATTVAPSPEIAVTTVAPSPEATATATVAPTPTPGTKKTPEVSVVVPTLNAPQAGADGTVTLSGTGAPGSTVEIWADGELVGQTTVGADGVWALTAPLKPGDYAFTARAVDAAGKTLAESEPLSFTMPAPPVAAPTLNAPQAGADGTVTLSGTGAPGSTVEIWADGELVGQTTVGADGVWTLTAPLKPGDYAFTARAVDAAGKTLAESEPFSFTMPAPPVAAPTLNTPQAGADGTVTLSGTGAPGSTVEIWADGELVGQTTVGADGVWTLTAPLKPGDYAFTARAVDAAGKTLAESEPFSFTMPAPPVAAPTLNTPQAGADGTVTLSGTGAPGSTVEIWADGELVGQTTVGADGVWTLTAPLKPGDYAFTARAVDAAGKTLAESEPLSFTMPAAKPVLTSPKTGDKLSGDTLTLAGTGQPGMEIEILDNGKVIGKAVVQADGTWTFDYKCAPGAHTLSVQNAGDATSASAAVNVEVAAKPVTDLCSGKDIPMGVDQGTTYIVARCEYMGLIARRVGVKLADLIAANPQVKNPNLIYPGQVLNLPPR